MEKLIVLIQIYLLFLKCHYCESDIDECQVPKICNNGVCVNVPGTYQCYCRPGYTGDSCEQDIDECLSAPCRHGGSCRDLENNFECDCAEGFEGKDCSVNIDDCAGAPCGAGGTCVDGVNDFTCLCPEGLTGAKCEQDIDDCEGSPCQHGGRCVDLLNGFQCDCAGTGHAGAACELNVDECASTPCAHGAACVDELDDYRCVCHAGYTGKNCEVDINECLPNPCQHGGQCLEHSNTTLYQPAAAAAQPLLPAVFSQPFSYENASGFSCICVPGTVGARCETDVDECASGPCAHGTCVDHTGHYSCDCLPGYEGPRCSLDIDECARYQPCVHGRCVDGRATYTCECQAGWGGANCSVALAGCRAAPCRHRGHCRPWLRGESDHRFNCTCAPGYAGQTCQQITTMSFSTSSYAEVNTSREEGYDISFRFKTTLGSGLLAMGRGLTYFFLELSDGRLNLHSSLLNKWEGVFIGSNLNDSNWQKVFVTINSSHVVLAANEEQTIYPISQNEAFNSSVTSFPVVRLGAAGSGYATLTHGPNAFVGCFQDVLVNGLWVLPDDTNSTDPDLDSMDPPPEPALAAASTLRGVSAGCPRAPQCEPNPCRRGACHDAWTSFRCQCARPALGNTCQYTYTAATFGHEAAVPRSLVAVRVEDAARRLVHAAIDISMFVRTRKPTGYIFYLGSGPRYGQTDETLVGASLKGGELLVHLRFNQTPEEYTVGGTRLDNGHLHLIQVVRNSTLVQVKLNGTEYFRKSISAAKQLDAQVLYLGGPPPPASPPPAPAPAPPAPGAAPAPAAPLTTPAPAPEDNDDDYFKGVIQDVQISNGVNVSVVEVFPLREPGLAVPPPFGRVTVPAGGVLPGEVSDDACAAQPCLHDAPCAVTWNDFTCTCPRGYKGKTCGDVEFCQLQACPLNTRCNNLDGGYECVSNATFDGVNTTLAYQLRVPRDQNGNPREMPPPTTLDITYRTKWGGTIFHAWLGSGAQAQWLTVAAWRAQVTAHWRLGAALPAARRLRAAPAPAPAPAADWRQLTLRVNANTLTGAFVDSEGREAVGFSESIDAGAWQRLLTEGHITLGGPARRPPRATAQPPTTTAQEEPATEVTVWEYSDGDDPAADDAHGEYFKGCLGAVHVGGLLLPFFTEEELFVGSAAALLAAQPHYALLSGRPWGAEAGVGCVLCLERDCAHGGHCADVRTQYTCACPAGYAGDHCELDIDECERHECQHGATCRDGLAGYECLCADGFEGPFCETDIDECVSSPCGAGGTCVDRPGGYACECPPPCHPRTHYCRPEPISNNGSCSCYPGFVGERCDRAYCELRPCLHGVCDADAEEPHCACEEGWTGAYCEAAAAACAPASCLHGGRCRPDQPCDCADTGYRGARCEVDVDECAEGLVQCGPGECRNLDGGYTCECAEGFCGDSCALLDPCVAAPPVCEHGGACEQRCTTRPDYTCRCVDGWGGRNCSQQVVAEAASGGLGTGWRVALGAAGALLALALLGAGLALAAGARRTRATRGTYSPSGQEYCNPRAAGQPRALQPPPEERLI